MTEYFFKGSKGDVKLDITQFGIVRVDIDGADASGHKDHEFTGGSGSGSEHDYTASMYPGRGYLSGHVRQGGDFLTSNLQQPLEFAHEVMSIRDQWKKLEITETKAADAIYDKVAAAYKKANPDLPSR